MNKKFRHIPAIFAIILVCIAVGFLIDGIWTHIDKEQHPRDYSEEIRKYSEEYNVPVHIIYAVIKVESNFDPKAESDDGALGLMQIMPTTFDWLTSNDHLAEKLPRSKMTNPEVNIRYGTYYLYYLYNKFEDWNTTLAAYNGGEGKVREWLSDKNYSSDGKTLDEIPYKETSGFVIKVNEAMGMYKKLYYQE